MFQGCQRALQLSQGHPKRRKRINKRDTLACPQKRGRCTTSHTWHTSSTGTVLVLPTLVIGLVLILVLNIKYVKVKNIFIMHCRPYKLRHRWINENVLDYDYSFLDICCGAVSLLHFDLWKEGMVYFLTVLCSH